MSLEQAVTTLVDANNVDFGTASNPLYAGQGPAALLAGAWPFLLTNGTDTAALATSSAIAAGSQGLVVYLGEEDINVNISGPTTCNVTTVTVTTVETAIVSANTSRLQLSIFNEGAQAAFVRLGAGATTTLFTVRISNNSFYELPYPVYTGAISGITSVGTAALHITECT